jgi:hypothetical protein
MNFLFVDKSYSNKAILDATKLPKYYKIPPNTYEVLLQNNTISIRVNQKISNKKYNFLSKKIESLIYSLVNASKGYKNCEMTPAKFIRILSAFTNEENSPALNFSYTYN